MNYKKLNVIRIVFILLFSGLIIMGCSQESDNNWVISSPNNNISVNVNLDDQGNLHYSITNQTRSVIDESPLGIVFEEASFENGLKFLFKEENYNLRDSYRLLTGKRRENNPEWNELSLGFENPGGDNFVLNFRVFDNGAAFNYEFEGEHDSSYTLERELSGFRIPQNSSGWMQPYDTIWQWAPAYETFFENRIPVGTPAPDNKNGWSFPMLFHTGSDWTLISDARMDEGHTGMYVDGNPIDGLYTLILPLEEEAMGLCPSRPELKLPFSTPWRVAVIGDNPGTILESNLIFHLSAPNILDDISWIKPGRSGWSWWSESDSPRDYDRLKEFVDFTAEMGWEYFLVDANWNEMQGGTAEELVSYANSIGVGIALWYNSGGPHNIVTEAPRDLMHLEEPRRKEFSRISQWGVKAIKIDFFQSDKACIMQQYHDILKDAAEFRLLVNVHGSTIPRGWERTYPNLMTMESVRGAESYKFAEGFSEYAPIANTILPFTRNVIGSMDYTPVAFSDSRFPKKTTHAHELALAVVFESGLQHFADSDHAYREQPEYVIEYLKNVPVAWDETRYIDGFPGEMVILARKNDDIWYVSGISGLNESIHVGFHLDFLPEGNYRMDIISDGADDKSFSFNTVSFVPDHDHAVHMLPRGGFSAVITPE